MRDPSFDAWEERASSPRRHATVVRVLAVVVVLALVLPLAGALLGRLF